MKVARLSLWLLLALCAGNLAGCPRPAQPPTSQSSQAALQFQDVADTARLKFHRFNGAFGKYWMPETMGGGGAFLDYDNDGWLDVLLVNGDWWPGHAQSGPRPTLALYHNNQDGTFTDVTDEAGLNVSLQGMGVAVGDYDNDGYADLYVTAVGGNRLFHNEGGKRFKDVTQQARVGGSGWSTSAAWLDYDNDGKLDLFVCHYINWTPETDIFCGTTKKSYCRPDQYSGQSCRLYHNEGNGYFTDVTQQAGLQNENSKALGICVCDLNNDGLPDLIVANDMEANAVYRNNGNGTFTEIGFQTGLDFDANGKARAGMGIDAADTRNDGTQAVAIGNFSYEGLAYYVLTSVPPYEEQAKRAGVFNASYPYVTFGLFFADFDNDGWPDLFITNGHIQDTVSQRSPDQSYEQPNVVFRNNANSTFTDMSKAAGAAVTQPLVGRGACRGDFDNDGRMDVLLIPNIGPPRLLKNTMPTQNHWLALKLIGTKSNRNGYGAKVSVEAGGITRTAYARSGSSYLSASDPRLHFGLGTATKVERVTVLWPSGATDTWTSVPVDQVTALKEGTARVAGY